MQNTFYGKTGLKKLAISQKLANGEIAPKVVSSFLGSVVASGGLFAVFYTLKTLYNI
jgi:hypothetical protein